MFDAACCLPLTSARLKCNDETYKCSSQDEASNVCVAAHLRLCYNDEIESEIGAVCAYMYTSSSTTKGYYIGNGGDGCGGSSKQGELIGSTGSYGGTGMFDAACCLPLTSARLKCNDETYKCSSQDEASNVCVAAHLRLCYNDEIES